MEKIKAAILAGDKELGGELYDYLQKADDFDVLEVCRDGLSGLMLLENKKPDVALVDLNLPELDGFGVLDNLKTINLKTKVIVFTSFNAPEIIAKAEKKGAAYCIKKPFDFEFLKDLITDVINNKTAGANKNTGGGAPLPQPQPQLQPVPPSFHRGAKKISLEEKITNLFLSVGIPAHVKGYNFLREAVKLAVYNPNVINNITKVMYPQIASRFATSSSKVERAIRHAIGVAFSRGRLDNLNAIFGIKIFLGTERPTNSEFIALIADRMILEGA